jgi:DNA-binding LacI/PurR family transcriptional regulator
MQSNECAETELKNLLSMEDNMVDGVLISLTKETKNLTHLEDLIKQKFPLVLFNRINESLPIPKVVFNDYKWALFATEHLIEQGCKNIYHLSGPKHLMLTKNRIRGFERALEKHKLFSDESKVIETGFSIEDGERVMEQILKSNSIPDGIFAINDPTAIGAMKVLKKYGYKIPHDVAVIGFSNSKMAEVVEPSLSSVKQPTFEMGVAAARLLLQQLTSPEIIEPKTIVMEGKLIIRDSSTKSVNPMEVELVQCDF